ncbi:dehydrogenase [Marinobacterium zhoushanense]|uniref:Dehydrogenase n=1 Tax=Marinobacterium zhoushanense TaxID=1679163 RepID=A0ABQ1K820_9GAMM|nr:PQQ-dependent sugar dehydrogenase [Marinobacterium zhoushanense]GGB90962.1 dehydrogenase [Marinobacterium zhoushanense]
MRRLILSWPLVVAVYCLPVAAAEPVLEGESAGMRFRVEALVQGGGVPWGMTFLNRHRLLFTRREGGAAILDIDSETLTELTGTPRVMSGGQGGFLDVAVPPGYTEGGWLYFTWVKNRAGQGVTVLSRARLQDTRLTDWQELLETKSATDTGRHFGSRIAFDNGGHVYFTVGDRGHRPNGQDLQTHAGSVLRLKLDGTVPSDNPFVGRAGAQPEIWSYGHRNSQGLAWDAEHGRLWEIEHGPRGGDEINLILSGANYGWPVLSYGKEYWGPFDVGEGTERAGMEPPVKVYIPSIAPGSLLYYSGDAFPAWRGNLIAGALKLTHLNRVELNEKGEAVAEERLLGSLGERIRALIQGPEGWLYFSTDSGRILRLRPK